MSVLVDSKSVLLGAVCRDCAQPYQVLRSPEWVPRRNWPRSAFCIVGLMVGLLGCADLKGEQRRQPLQSKPQRIAVLELRSQLVETEPQRELTAYFTDAIRGYIHDSVPSLSVMTKENILLLLSEKGGTLADCESDCEVETGRRLGADLIVTGEVLRVGSQLTIVVRVHDTHTASLLKRAEIEGDSPEALKRQLPSAVDLLMSAAGLTPALSDRGHEVTRDIPPTNRPQVPDAAVPARDNTSSSKRPRGAQASASECQPGRVGIHQVAGWTALVSSLAGAAAMGAAFGEKQNVDSLAPGDAGVSSGISAGQAFNVIGIGGLGLGALGLTTFLLSFPSTDCGSAR